MQPLGLVYLQAYGLALYLSHHAAQDILPRAQYWASAGLAVIDGRNTITIATRHPTNTRELPRRDFAIWSCDVHFVMSSAPTSLSPEHESYIWLDRLSYI
jgi:hypothetical protein